MIEKNLIFIATTDILGRFDENIAKDASLIDFTSILKQCHFSEYMS